MTKLLSLDEVMTFLQKSGKPMDYDGAFGGECVDIPKYILDMVYGGGKIGRIGNANELWNDKYGILKKMGFIRIEGIKNMQRGDFIFLNTGISFQHVGAFLEERASTVLIFDQVGNGDKVGGELPPSYREWSKSIVLGVWRHKDAVLDPAIVFANEHNIRKRGKDEYFSCHDILSIFAKLK